MKAHTYRIVLAQLLMTLLAGGIWWLCADKVDATSALIGGGIAVTANFVFAYRLRAGQQLQAARALLGNFYLSELIKILITVALFALAFKTRDIRFLPMMTTYGATFIVNWGALLVFKPGNKAYTNVY